MQGSAKSQSTWQEQNVQSGTFTQSADESHSAVLITGPDGIIKYVNPAFLDISGFKKEYVLGKGLWLLTSGMATGEAYRDLMQHIAQNKTWKGELRNRTAKGHPYILSVRVAPCQDEYGDISHFIITGQDITPFKETQLLLNKSCTEKEALFSELHLRVKDNLSAVTNMLEQEIVRMQPGPEKSKMSKVKTMAALHGMLYASGSMYQIEFGTYLEKIINKISAVYPEAVKNLNLRQDIDTLNLSLKQAHPLSLLVSEVISNAFKYAFSKTSEDDGHTHTLAVQLYKHKQDVHLFVTNNGKSLEPDMRGSLSPKIMDGLAAQLNADYNYSARSSGGSVFHIKFKVEAINPVAGENFC